MLFDVRLYARLARLALTEPMSRRRRRTVVFVLIAAPVLAALHAVCWLLDPLLFWGLWRVRVRAPVFIVGHGRSGTTHLHRLVAADRERWSSFAMWEMFFPSLLERWLVRRAAALDARLGAPLGRRIRAFEDRAFAKGRQMHPMGLTQPEEDEFLLALPFSSPTVAVIFPYLRELQPWDRFDELLPARRRRRILRFYRAAVRRQLWLNGPGRTHLAKNPVFSGKVASLLETFPDARFVVCVRSPYETIPSLQKMMERNWKASDVDRARIADSLRVLFENSLAAYRHPFEVLDARPDVRSTVVRYEDLVARPRETVEAVYAALGEPVTPALREALAAEEKRSREHRSEHVYSLAEYGLQREQIRAALAPLFERFGWA
jgi:hypothetical protein